MAWVRLDDQFPDHPKIEHAGEKAAWLFVCGLCYCAEHLTDGFVPHSKALRLTATAAPRIRTLLEVGLWEAVDGGYSIVGYLEYQPPAEKVKAARDEVSRKRAEAGRKGADHRWADGKTDGKPMANDMANAWQTDGKPDGKDDGKPMAPSPSPSPYPTTSTTPPTTSSCPPEPGGGDDRLTEAATVLAQREADRRGSEIGNPAGYVRSRTKPIRDEHEPVWRRLLEAHPTMTVSQLVASLDAPPQPTPLDGTLRAARTLADRERRRRCGEACPDCDDVGMVELDDGRFTDCRCKQLPVAT